MIATTYVLIMIWTGNQSTMGMLAVTQEFNSYESCEIARKNLLQIHSEMFNKSNGCFKK